MTEPTKDRLARDLEEAGLGPLAERARSGEFDDYESPHPMPKHVLVQALHNWGRPELAQRVVQGEYDNTAEEGTSWLRGPEGRATKRRLGF